MTLDRNEKRTKWALAITLALVAGYVDGYALLFFKTYVSFMSGNTTMMGLRAGQGDFTGAWPGAIAILFFVVGSFIGSLLVQSRGPQARRIVFGAIAALLATVISLEWRGVRDGALDIALLSLAMSMINPVITKIGLEPVSLTFMTGTLERIGVHLASAASGQPVNDKAWGGDSHLGRAGIEATLWAALVGGAVLSGLAGPMFRMQGLLIPCALMAGLAVASESTPPA